MTPKSRGEKSHSGIPGSKAACAYPGLIAACRALLQLSSRAILQTAWHVGPFGGICLAFGETLFVYMCASLLLPMHGVILSSAFSSAVQFTLRVASVWVRRCIYF